MTNEQDQNKKGPKPRTPRGKFDETKIEYIGDVELTPEEDAKITRMTAQADAEIAHRQAQRKIKHLGTVELTPEEDAEFTRMTEEAEADIAQRKAQRTTD